MIEPEIRGALAWADRREIASAWNPESLEMRTVLRQPGDLAEFFLRGRFDRYPFMAPEWTFSDAIWARAGQLVDFPKPITNPAPPTASIFLAFGNGGVICAPFNRLAYKSCAGPHGDWGGPEQWFEASAKTSAQKQVRADTVGDMLQVIYRDFLLTRGRMGNA